MDFLQFARAHGVIIHAYPALGRWVRLPTVDKPKHRNGAVKYLGDHGFVQNHATQQDVSTWRAEGESAMAQQEVQRVAREASQEIARNNARAASEAAKMLADAELATHAYFASKGFPGELVNVIKTDAGPLALIPMFINGELVGCQKIAEDGTKKFIAGQRSGGAQFIFGSRGPHIVCEGYATALSARDALRNAKRPYRLHVTFSAGNMKKIAADLPGGIVLADNDASGTGERTAREIGWPYWMSDVVGEDCNDYMVRKGLFFLSQGIGRVLREAMAVP